MNRARGIETGDECRLEFRNGPKGRVMEEVATVDERDGRKVVLDIEDGVNYTVDADGGLVFVGESFTNAQIGRDARLFRTGE